MKRYGICYRTSRSGWDAAFIDAFSDQAAILLFCERFATVTDQLCIGHVIEWQSKGDPNGQYILTAA